MSRLRHAVALAVGAAAVALLSHGAHATEALCANLAGAMGLMSEIATITHRDDVEALAVQANALMADVFELEAGCVPPEDVPDEPEPEPDPPYATRAECIAAEKKLQGITRSAARAYCKKTWFP